MRRSVYTLRVLPFYNAPFLRSSIAQIRPGEGSFFIFWKIWRLAQSDGVWFVRMRWVFFIFSVVERLTGLGWAAAVYPAGVLLHPSAPGTPAHHRQQGRPCQMQGKPRKARHTRPDAGHAAPACTLYQTAHAGQIVTVRDAEGRGVCPANYTFSDTKYFPRKRV